MPLALTLTLTLALPLALTLALTLALARALSGFAFLPFFDFLETTCSLKAQPFGLALLGQWTLTPG